MAKLRVQGVPPFDGEYELDPQNHPFNGHELHLIKKVAGLRLGEIDEALTAGDYDLIIAITAIAIWRAGKATRDQLPDLVEMLLDAESGAIRDTTGKQDDNPPAEAPTPGATDDNSTSSSEDSSSTSDGHQETTLRAIGSHG